MSNVNVDAGYSHGKLVKWIGLAGCLIGLLAACGQPGPPSSPPHGVATTPGTCPRTPPGPPSEVGRQEAEEHIPAMGIGLLPPDASDVALTCGNAAIAEAWNEEAKGSSPTRSVAKLTDFQGEKFGASEEILVWVVSFKGFCVPIEGTIEAGPGCAGHELNVVVDATTGEYMFSFSYR